ncbi:hypothetical protein PCANC_09820 [Puccinia coronata f. sp. avenae]|uniref:CxC1-like cysteine cluster associated with KDZ transposases domain-containing protein n=1 Tax=Puccinia coronata f. sp. avenae TaxID=200324 RepID=A0A2N5T0I8_9BASI|nr:hypothetical protein PCANC_09820 [Puccinia coronata f. sp. avenae]
MPRIRRIARSHRGNRTQQLRQDRHAKDYSDEIERLRNAQRRARLDDEENDVGYPGNDFLDNQYDSGYFSDDNLEDKDMITTSQWLHAVYMIQKHRTDNWTSQNTYDSFVKCRCYTHSNWPVDLIDIYARLCGRISEPQSQRLCAKNRDHFNLAVQRHLDTLAILLPLLELPNPSSSSGRNYTEAYFKKQWKLQRKFKSQQATSDEKEKKDLVALYKKEATLHQLRICLINPQAYLCTADEVNCLRENIEQMSEEVAIETIRLGIDLPTVDVEEQKLRLLLWDSKSELYVQAVHLHAERHPIDDAQRRGSRLGTELKEKIFKAIQARKPAIVKLLNVFNHNYQAYKEQFPNQEMCIVDPFPLTYKAFSAMPLDHVFWNNGLYYHSQAPWATNTDVFTGINCVLILSRIQEEFELLAQELPRGVGWAINLYNMLSNRIAEIETEEWSGDVVWLWSRCQPSSHQSNSLLMQWLEMNAKIVSNKQNALPSSDAVDEGLEDVILEVGFDDGKEANDGWIGEDGAGDEEVS